MSPKVVKISTQISKKNEKWLGDFVKEWYSEITNNYWPEIEVAIKETNEETVHKFVGLFDGLAQRTSGLFVLTDQNMYIRGKPKTGAWTPVWELAKGKNLVVIPLNSIFEIIQKQNVFVLRLKLDYMGGKYIGKLDKVKFEMYQGKEGKEKESKQDLMQRAEELKAYLDSKKSA